MNNGYFTQVALTEFVMNLAGKLAHLNFNICSNDIVEINASIQDKNELGEISILGPHQYKLNLSHHLLWAHKEPFLRTSVLHELSHIIQYNEAFDFGAIKYENSKIMATPGKEVLANNIIFDNAGHTDLWWAVVNDISSKIEVDPPIKAFTGQRLIDQFLEAFFVEKEVIEQMQNGIVKDTVIAGFTIDDVEKYSFKEYSGLTAEQAIERSMAKIEAALKNAEPPKHEYREKLRAEIEKLEKENK